MIVKKKARKQLCRVKNDHQDPLTLHFLYASNAKHFEEQLTSSINNSPQRIQIILSELQNRLRPRELWA
jgi:hypothetical protein